MNGKILATYRKQNKLSQEKLAQKLNVSRSTVAMWENNSNEPDHKTLIKICLNNAPIFELFPEFISSTTPANC